MRILTLALAIIWMAIFNGCMNPIPNKFLTSNNYGFVSQCAGIFDFGADYEIDDSKIYAFKKTCTVQFILKQSKILYLRR